MLKMSPFWKLHFQGFPTSPNARDLVFQKLCLLEVGADARSNFRAAEKTSVTNDHVVEFMHVWSLLEWC